MKTNAQMNADEVTRIRAGLVQSQDPHPARLNREASDDDLMKMKAAFARATARRPMSELLGS